ncbi:MULTISPECIES: GNAT family N-acetyltransferase [Glaesserella]|uniref:tRNA cytosine(34) acetyltransferase TmcA n=1 Tax=Glaesserella australis TaxID=2094024 RepID=A0A328BZB9_9PAST|nr:MULTISPECIES: GNAT family N-acetyltransferase [Glaesserella]AUI65721.1 tRNA cytosine(34) acetyltransferase TmcA [Glaesserella sp. 15-184]RAL18995.1 tRNA cytosine(34) acetyltransferase TmcA [Glaesserella australis]
MRHLAIIDHFPEVNHLSCGGIYLPNQTVAIPFSNAKTLLGQEFPYTIYDMRAKGGICFNLDAFAIVAGTIQENGTLYLLCPEWENLEQQLDFDALRWNAQQPIATPNFYRYFKGLVEQFGFLQMKNRRMGLDPSPIDLDLNGGSRPTLQMQNIFNNLPLDPADIHFILAPRGRGKSTLSGKLAEQISKTASVLITARSHSALPNFWKGIKSDNVTFFSPDRLIQMIEQQNISPKQWLFIDEAASLPLPMLQHFCDYFEKVVLTTTTQNYEGTGHGFCLKFLPRLSRSTKQWELSKPLRWGENDLLETFVSKLLLLEDLPLSAFGSSPRKQGEQDWRIAFYQLLAQAHYKTTPTDLRRLFDAPNQHYFDITEGNQLIAGAWGVNEGELDNELTQAIWRGERRPQGSLVAQYLCFQGNLPEACLLKSVRISRIAVQPEYQQQGYGKRLVSQIILQISPLVDFVSVSFGMSKELLHFWQSCGFKLVQITPTAEASSGYPSAMMLYPTSIPGRTFVEKAHKQFQRDYPLFQNNEGELSLDQQDLNNLHGFAHTQRTFIACYVSLKRLYFMYPKELNLLRDIFTTPLDKSTTHQKAWIQQLRQIVQNLDLHKVH